MSKFEKAVLEAIRALGADASSLAIWHHVNAGRRWWNRYALISMYFAFDALEKKGYVVSYVMPGGPDRNFKPRLFFYITRTAPGTE